MQADNGPEYCNTEFDNYLTDQGIQRKLTIYYIPQQNRIAERMNITFLDMARCS